MDIDANLPFKVGDLVEARSFQTGYRGAWFRCKIIEISKRQQVPVHSLEYYDFPDEKRKWMRLYQVPPYPVGNAKEKQRELMLRPHYPPIYDEQQLPHVSEISEMTVIVDNSWKVGDLVDWWTTGCYWCGRITQLLGNDKAQIELKPPPLGEGSSYEVFLKDVRPSLDWSPEHGWTIPTQEEDTGRPCARLIKPINQDVSDEAKSTTTPEMEKCSVRETVSNKEVKDEEEKSTSSKKRTSSELAALNINQSDTLEAAIMDLEECLNKVKWLKTILHCGISSSADAATPQWEILESNSASGIPK